MSGDLCATDANTEPAGGATAARDLPPAARRALAEAEERRRIAMRREEKAPKEIDGREGPEPVRYGDWEVKGIASDF